MTADAILDLATLAGTALFAASGALAGVRRHLDVVGCLFIGALTGIGGGTLRDLLLGPLPVSWVTNPSALIACTAGAFAGIFGARAMARTTGPLLWADAAGLSLFAAVGAAKGIAAGAHPATAALMGVVTATFGGIMRDVVCNELPVLLYREIYITAAAAGAAVMAVGAVLWRPSTGLMLLAIATTFVVRAAAIVFGLSLPGSRGQAPALPPAGPP